MTRQRNPGKRPARAPGGAKTPLIGASCVVGRWRLSPRSESSTLHCISVATCAFRFLTWTTTLQGTNKSICMIITTRNTPAAIPCHCRMRCLLSWEMKTVLWIQVLFLPQLENRVTLHRAPRVQIQISQYWNSTKKELFGFLLFVYRPAVSSLKNLW